jgi:hypothetical protein
MPFVSKTGLFTLSRGKKPASSGIPTSGLLINLDANNASSYSGSGTTWTDLTGSNYNGVLTNGPTFTSSAPKYFVLDGVDDYINITNATALQPGVGGTSAVTAIIWAYITSYAANDGIISKQYGATGGYDGFSYVFNTNNRMMLNMNGGSVNGNYVSASTNVFSLNTWTMFTCIPRFGGTTTNPSKGYVNTTEVISVANSESSIPSNNAPIRLASGIQEGSPYPACQIGSFYYYNRALSAAEITSIYNTTKTRFGL